MPVLIFISIITPASSQTISLDEAFHEYWNATSAVEQSEAMGKIEDPQTSFDDVYAHLKQGKDYSPNVKHGFLCWDRTLPNGVQLFALIFIPYDYTPEKKWPARVLLHGGVSSPDPYNVLRFIDTSLQDYKTVEQIRIYPSAYFAATWYYDLQNQNVLHLLDSVKKIYNVDENRISLSGFSDGATGTYAFANFNCTPYSCFLPYIGSPIGLKFLGDAPVYFLNFTNKPFFIVNGKLDQIFPPEVVQPYADQIMRLNNEVSFIMLDTAGHTLGWLPLLKDTIDHFIASHQRNPYPNHLIWETDNTENHNRNHWVIITKIGETRHYDHTLEDENMVIIRGNVQPAFKRGDDFGIIEVNADGHTVHVKTRGVKEFTLLLSPDQFDFSKEIVVYTNDLVSFRGKVEKNISTLLKWNLTDNDRAMLFAAELHIKTDTKAKVK